MGVLRFGYGTTSGIHSKQLCLTANVSQLSELNVVGALIFFRVGGNYWLRITKVTNSQ